MTKYAHFNWKKITGVLEQLIHSAPGVGSKGQNVFSESSQSRHVAYQIKGNGAWSTMQTIFCPYTHPQPPDGVKRSKHFFAEGGHAAYQIKGNKA